MKMPASQDCGGGTMCYLSTTTSDTSTKEVLKKKKKEDFITSVPELSGTRISF